MPVINEAAKVEECFQSLSILSVKVWRQLWCGGIENWI